MLHVLLRSRSAAFSMTAGGGWGFDCLMRKYLNHDSDSDYNPCVLIPIDGNGDFFSGLEPSTVYFGDAIEAAPDGSSPLRLLE